MDCDTVHSFLQVYVDGELDGDDRRDVEQHMGQCERCRAQAEYERRFRDAIRARIPRPLASRDLRERIEASLEQTTAPRKLALLWGSLPAAAALVAVIAFNFLQTTGFTLADEAVQRHSSEPPVEVSTSDSAEIERWFRSKVDFNVALPHLGQEQMQLEGGRLSNLDKRQAAYVRYRSGPNRFSLFVMSDNGSESLGQRCRRIDTQEFCLSEVRGFSVILWRSRGLLYSMVGDSAPDELLQALTSP